MISDLFRFLPVLVVTGVLSPLAARAADAESVPKAAASTPAAKPLIDTSAEKGNEKLLREQDIYVPYEKLRQVFERHGRGVFLPYEQFEELWRAAQDKTRPAAEVKPPVGAVVTEVANEATVAKDVVRVKAVLKIDILAEGWHEIPLRLADAAITSATIGGKAARIIGGPGEGHRLLIEKKGKQPESTELTLEYAKAIARTPGQNSVSFEVPQAPVSRWRVRIPQSGVKVNFQPLIAATEVPSEADKTEEKKVEKKTEKKEGEKETGEKKEEEKKVEEKKIDDKKIEEKGEKKAEETVVLAFVGAAPTVRIDWTPKAEGATGMAAIASVQAEQQVWINESVIRVRTALAYTISRAELTQLAVEVPADYKVVNVFDPNVRQWAIEPMAANATVQQITAQLFEPAKNTQRVTVELEKVVGEKRQDSVRLPVVKVLNVGRQEGALAIQVAAGLRAEAVRTTGLLQTDAKELPPSISAGTWTFAYRYSTVPYELELSLEQVQPRITAETLVEAQLEPERLTLDLTAVFNIERAGIFKLELDVPEGFDVRRVAGREVKFTDPATRAVEKTVAADVDSHHLEGAKKTRLIVNLARKTMGRVALGIQLHKDLQEPKLLVPGKAAQIALPLPQVAVGTVQRSVGRLVISAPESLRVDAGKADGLRSISLKEATEAIEPLGRPAGNAPGSTAPNTAKGGDRPRPVLAFAFTQDPVALRLEAERRKPQVTVRQLLVARIEEGVIKYQATFFYDVLYSGVKSLEIDVPADIAKGLRNTSTGIHDKVLEGAPDASKSTVTWSFFGDADLLGEGKIELSWEKKIDKLGIGDSLDLIVPRLVPRHTDRTWGQVVLAKAESLDVHESGEPKLLRPIDPQHDLMGEVSNAARAFEYHDEAWELPITITRYAMEEIKRSSIDRAVVRMVITPAQEIAVQALYRVRSTRQRLAVALPERAEFDTDPLRINGQSVGLERGQQGEFFIPLVGRNPDEPLLLELRYTVPGDGRQLDLPVFPDDAAVQKVYLCVFVPQERTLLGSTGSWNEEFHWSLQPPLHWAAIGTTDDRRLVSWVGEGIAQGGGTANSFHTDGRLYVFSTLRPASPANGGSLGLRTMDERGLNVAIFAVVILAGVALLTVGAAQRILAVGGGVVLLVLAGVFSPTFALQLFSGTLLAAVFVVLVIWSVACVFRLRPTVGLMCDAAAGSMAARAAAWRASRESKKTPPETAKHGPEVPSPEPPKPADESQKPASEQGGLGNE